MPSFLLQLIILSPDTNERRHFRSVRILPAFVSVKCSTFSSVRQTVVWVCEGRNTFVGRDVKRDLESSIIFRHSSRHFETTLRKSKAANVSSVCFWFVYQIIFPTTTPLPWHVATALGSSWQIRPAVYTASVLLFNYITQVV